MSISRQCVIGILADNQHIAIGRLVPVLQLLRELATEIGNTRQVFGIGIIDHDFLQHTAPGLEGLLTFSITLKFEVVFKQLEIALRNMELRLHGELLVAEYLTERRYNTSVPMATGNFISNSPAPSF